MRYRIPRGETVAITLADEPPNFRAHRMRRTIEADVVEESLGVVVMRWDVWLIRAKLSRMQRVEVEP